MNFPAATSAPGPIVSERYALRRPRAADGKSVHALISACAPLDTNSLYLNLLQCTHFADTCVSATRIDQPSSLAGFVSGYLLPNRPTTLFIWQVAIAASERGNGLASAMLFDLLERPACNDVDRIETTITESNSASWALFRSLARSLECPLEDRVLFDRNAHLDGVHESEVLVAIGPFGRRSASTNRSRRTTK
jgi:L-2,4-diaminobutyric acid acetyltransferase